MEGERPKITLKATREIAVLEDGAHAPGPDARAFIDHVDELLRRGGNRDLLIYVHGANTNFESAAAQAAQFQHFLGRDAVVMVFAWPSAGSLLRYGRDVATTRRSVPVFARLLEQVSEHTEAAHLNVLAYSAGSMIASPGLARASDGAAAAADSARLLAEVLKVNPQPDEKKALLAALTRFICPESLAVAKSLIADPAVAAEAKSAADRIERAIPFRR